jgi:glutamate 5-kinase
MNRHQLGKSRRWVVKIGSALLTNAGRGLDKEVISRFVAQMAQLRNSGVELILVSSGAVADGMMRLGWTTRPRALYELQAAAAVGQMGLVQAYESCFHTYGMHTAQILLTHDDLSNRKRYLNARSTLRTLLSLGVVPVINENDTVAFEEIRLGDNDTLAALVANLIEAQLLVILTDQQGMFDKDPRVNPEAKLIPEAMANDPKLERMAGGAPGTLGRGGMLTKVRAAVRAARSGTSTIIAPGKEANVLTRIVNGEQIGTLLLPGQEPITARKRWLAGQLQVRGKLILDAGAVRALRDSGRSLLPIGVKWVQGDFNRGELVACMDEQDKEIARGLVNYNAEEADKIKGQSTDKIETLLGYVDEPELIHRDNLALT